ncbi:MAG: hypothetical protein DCC55_15065 [Chloroflexi bacterium]|nr:MAG: hypothetical protein DCC55_15065 [Chloroflexota bacterium]
MRCRRINSALAVLAVTLLVLSGCGEQEETMPTPALNLATPTPSESQAAIPTQTVVTPTQGEEGADAAETPAGATPAEGEEQAAAAPEMNEEELISTGEQVYAGNCASCHQPGGEGTDTYPALTQSELLTAEDPTQAIEIVVHGRGEMPAFAETLSAEEIAAVLSYERNAWDNNAPVVTVAQVEQVQQDGAAAQGAQPMTTTATATATTAVTATPMVAVVETVQALAATVEALAQAQPPATDMETPTPETPAPEEDAPTTGTPAATSAEEEVDEEQLISMGERVYAANCASCHQLSGQGTNVYPALAASDMLTAEDPTGAIEIVLYGRGEMPAFEDTLSTEEIAAVLSYERSSWDNNASMVTVAQVEQVQGATQEESDP